MFSALRTCSILLLATMMLIGLAACSTTDTGSTAVIEDSSIETPEAAPEAEEAPVADEEPMQFDTSPEISATQPSDEPSTVVTPEEAPSSATGPSTGAAEKTETVEPIADFPITPYEIEEPDSMASESETDAEIERLREDLAATESELDQIRAEEEKRDYSSSDAATSSESSADTAGSQQSATSGAQAPETQTDSTVSQAPMEPSHRDVTDLPGMPAENSIFFGFDQATVDSEYEAILVQHAIFLKSHPELKIEVQGNCDERGSREYNIALGQRRAFTVKRALELLGIDGNRIETVSFGSEKPMAFGHDEESWRLNRRADIVYVN